MTNRRMAGAGLLRREGARGDDTPAAAPADPNTLETVDGAESLETVDGAELIEAIAE